jgi:hypothetical protein
MGLSESRASLLENEDQKMREKGNEIMLSTRSFFSSKYYIYLFSRNWKKKFFLHIHRGSAGINYPVEQGTC